MSTENLPPYTTIEPLGGALSGACHVPGDKSISHRAVLFPHRAGRRAGAAQAVSQAEEGPGGQKPNDSEEMNKWQASYP